MNTDHRSDAEHHLQQAALFPAGSEDERYHTYTASILANLYGADANREHAAVAAQMVDVQERLYDLMTAQPEAAPADGSDRDA